MTKKLYKLMNWADVEGIVYAEDHDPVLLSGRGQCCDRDR